MIFPKRLYVFLLLANVGHSTGNKTRTTFIKVPIDLNLAGLKCARDHYSTNLAVRYDLLARTCEPLDETWLSNQTRERNFNYFKLSMVEPIFSPRMRIEVSLPNLLLIGLSVVVYVEPLVTRGGVMGLDFKPMTNTDIIALHVNVRPTTTVFNTRIDGQWAKEIEAPGYMFKGLPLSVHKFEFRFNKSNVEINVNGITVNIYTHRMSVSNYQVIEFYSEFFLCRQIQFFYPQ